MADFLTRLGRVGGSTASGALAGTAFGPIGTLVGGGVGLVGGLFSDSAANDADIASERADRSAREARERNRQYIDQLMGEVRGQQNPFGSQAMAGQYNQIARNYAGAQSGLNSTLAARGIAGQASGDALNANLAASQANAVTEAQSANAARSADWVRGQQQALMQLQGLSQNADQADMASAAQMAQMRANSAQQAAAGLNSTLGGLATIGALKGDYGKGFDDLGKKLGEYGGQAQDWWKGITTPQTPRQLGGPYAPESFTGPWAPGFNPSAQPTGMPSALTSMSLSSPFGRPKSGGFSLDKGGYY